LNKKGSINLFLIDEETMLIKIVLVAVLSLGVSCFAESGADKSKPPADSNSPAQASSVASPATKENTKSSTQNSSTHKKPSMVDFCKKHPC